MSPLGIVAVCGGALAYLVIARMVGGHYAWKRLRSEYPNLIFDALDGDDRMHGFSCGIAWPLTLSIAALVLLCRLVFSIAPPVGEERRALAERKRRERERQLAAVREAERTLGIGDDR